MSVLRKMTPDPFLALVGALTLAVLVAAAGRQIYDSNLVSLPEATAILAGDRPYRDFFQWGAPLAAYLSAGAQLVVGYRLIGEFLLQWTLIVAGVVIAFHLGLRLSRSIRASLAVLPLALVIVAEAPTYHYSKLFCFPLLMWLVWRYMDRPDWKRSAAIGLASAVAFLFRHDYGAYAALAFVAAVVLAPPVGGSTRVRSRAIDVLASGVAAAVLVLPWAIVVQVNEGVLDYVRASSAMYERPRQAIVYASLLGLNPLLPFTPSAAPEPKSAVVGFLWNERVSESMRRELEQRYRLRPLGERDGSGRWQYEVANVYDTSLFELDPYITDGAGFEWNRLNEIRRHVPGRDNAVEWLQQVMLLVSLVILVWGSMTLWRGRHVADADLSDAKRMVVAGVFLVGVDSALLRQPSYVVMIAPLTIALGAKCLVAGTRVGRGVAIGTLLLTCVAAVVWARESLLFRPIDMVRSLPATFAQLLASPPDDGSLAFHYLRDCSLPGDHVLVTGMTPFQVNYYVQRPLAGGHLYWRTGWRSSPAQEERSLALLQAQSVPFAVSNRRPVLEDFTRYPRIAEYLRANYAEVEGSDGRILVDRRRHPAARFAGTAMPCFR
jgi:4-amino-4-deoxy-L-arabinose transferase-like glycosyltransferase